MCYLQKHNFSLWVTIQSNRWEMQALLALDVPTNFYVDLFGFCPEIRIFVDLSSYFNTFFYNKITSKAAQKRSETHIQRPETM